MRKLSLIILSVYWIGIVSAQDNPHGDKLKLDCADCHTTSGWKYVQTTKFDHRNTKFVLNGQHQFVRCADCHTSLVFTEAKGNCIDCHTDLHNTTIGPECARCHNENSWIVSNMTELHQFSRFPLLGAHNTADCADCHTSASLLEFEPLGVECIDCHQPDYMATTNPNHAQVGFSSFCLDCHKIDAFEWSASGINHDFFPLTQGHAINECAACHSSGITQSPPTDCYDCHQKDFNSATNPSHQHAGFSTNCTECHTTSPDWMPAEFKIHDGFYFPIFSGKHNGEWNSCTDCHQNTNNYSVFSCVDCHEHNRTEMDKEHREVSGYAFNSVSCYTCHTNGNADDK